MIPGSSPSRYLLQTAVTGPGDFREMLDVLPPSVPDLVGVVQGLLLHIFWTKRYGVEPDESQRKHVMARLVSAILRTALEIDPAPLAVRRPPERRFYGNCRDFSVLLCSMLRHKGIPARARCGFGTYFRPGWYEDHWICEYRSGDRWIRVDAQLDGLQQDILRIDFDPLDMPDGKFVNASEAWLLCRSGRADPDRFGIFDMCGLGFVLGNLIRELAALNDAEMLPWDVWGVMRTERRDWTQEHFALFDRIADLLTTGSADIYTIYEDEPGLRVPREMLVAGI